MTRLIICAYLWLFIKIFLFLFMCWFVWFSLFFMTKWRQISQSEKKKFQFWLFSFKFSWSELVTKLNVKEVTHMTELFLYSSQVVFVAISYLSQSSPQTAGCGLNSAAAVTGWEKASLLFMKVSAHSFHPPPSQHVVQLTKLSSSSDNVAGGRRISARVLALLLLMCHGLYAALIRIWLVFTCSFIISRQCVCRMCAWICTNWWINCEDTFLIFFFPLRSFSWKFFTIQEVNVVF